MPDDKNITVTTTFTSAMDGEVEVQPEDFQPPPPPEAETITGSTTDTEAGLRAVDGVPVKDSSLADYREVESGDVRVTSYEAPNSSRRRAADSFSEYQDALEELKFPEDAEFLDQLAEHQNVELPAAEESTPETPPEPNIIPAEQVAAVVENEIVLREHQARWNQAMADPQFAEYAANAPGADVVLDGQVLTAIAAQANSPVVVAFLQNRQDVAEKIASLPVPRAVAEVAQLSAWLTVQLQQNAPQNPAPRRVSAAPPPITPLGGNPTATTVVDLSNCDYQTYKRVRNEQKKRR